MGHWGEWEGVSGSLVEVTGGRTTAEKVLLCRMDVGIPVLHFFSKGVVFSVRTCRQAARVSPFLL